MLPRKVSHSYFTFAVHADAARAGRGPLGLIQEAIAPPSLLVPRRLLNHLPRRIPSRRNHVAGFVRNDCLHTQCSVAGFSLASTHPESMRRHAVDCFPKRDGGGEFRKQKITPPLGEAPPKEWRGESADRATTLDGDRYLLGVINGVTA
jgi:hypothetical protein